MFCEYFDQLTNNQILLMALDVKLMYSQKKYILTFITIVLRKQNALKK